jgi:hypothetical protein
MPTWAAASSPDVTATAPANEPSPNSRPSATRSPSNPAPHDGGFTFQDELHSRMWHLTRRTPPGQAQPLAGKLVVSQSAGQTAAARSAASSTSLASISTPDD